MATTKTKGSKAAGAATEAIEVIARRESFYRAGIEFGHAPTVVLLSEITAEQLDEIKNEPMLITRDIEIDPAQLEQAQQAQG